MGDWTPGPWGSQKAVEVWIMAGGLHVATIPRAHDGDWSSANARLIAAAPEIRDALDAMVQLAEPVFRDDTQREFLDRARATLAKAEGKTE